MDENIKLECLKMAVSVAALTLPLDPTQVVPLAAQFYSFVQGKTAPAPEALKEAA